MEVILKKDVKALGSAGARVKVADGYARNYLIPRGFAVVASEKMMKVLEEIRYDLRFIKSHTVQPKWYKVLKVFILVGFLTAYWYWFGLLKTVIFLAVFFFLSFLLHMLYRLKTHKYTQSWLDFVVVEENNEIKAKSIGKFYYSAIVFNAIISFLISQVIS